MTPEVERLISEYLDGELDSAGHAQLSDWLKADAQNADRFAEIVALHDSLLRQLDVEAQMPADQADVRIPSRSMTDAPRLRRAPLVPIAFGVSLVALVCLGLWYVQSASRDKQIPEVGTSDAPLTESFATIERVVDAEWVSGGEHRAGDRVGAGVLRLVRGMVRLRFDDGVEVTVQGAAEYQLIARGRTRLLSGCLAATVPPGAEGFEVDTPSAQVVDLGTAFGIELDDDGAANVTVFDGEVEVLPHGSETRRRLQEGDAVRLRDGGVEPLEFTAAPFERIWPVSSGIAGSSGAFRFAPAWPRRLSRVESDSEIFVVPEGYSTTLQEPLRVDITEPGVYADAGELGDAELPAGSQVRTFLLQFNPVGAGPAVGGPGRNLNRGPGTGMPNGGNRMAPPGRFPPGQRPAGGPGPGQRRGPGSKLRRIVGEITFDRPVLGLIVRARNLAASDPRFSARTRDADVLRQLELRGGNLGDVLTLSADRRSVKLELAAIGKRYDHVRVILDDSTQSLLATTHAQDASGTNVD